MTGVDQAANPTGRPAASETEKQRQLVLEENRRLLNECEYTREENRRLSDERAKWKRIAIPAVAVVIFGLLTRLLDGNQLNLWPIIGLVCVGLWISFANRGTRTHSRAPGEI